MSGNIIDYVQSCVDNYKLFVGISIFPEFNIKPKEMTLDNVKRQGYDAVAATFYDIPSGTHTLEIWSKLYLPQMNAEYLVYHEFTHIWDAEVYSQRDKYKHMSNKGYTEYHAAQIEFMRLLGANSIAEPFSFTIDQKIETIGGTISAQEFVDMPKNHASNLILREDFPANIETLSTTIGLIFNYYGRRSICKMYASDYNDNVDMNVIAGFLGKDVVQGLDKYMLGWFDAEKVSTIDVVCGKMLLVLAKRNKL